MRIRRARFSSICGSPIRSPCATPTRARVRAFVEGWGPSVPPEAGDAAPPDFASQCDALLAAEPPIVSSVMGLVSAAFVQRLEARGIAWFANVSTVAEAKAAEDAGADAIVAQGMEAGGHRGCFERATGRGAAGGTLRAAASRCECGASACYCDRRYRGPARRRCGFRARRERRESAPGSCVVPKRRSILPGRRRSRERRRKAMPHARIQRTRRPQHRDGIRARRSGPRTHHRLRLIRYSVASQRPCARRPSVPGTYSGCRPAGQSAAMARDEPAAKVLEDPMARRAAAHPVTPAEASVRLDSGLRDHCLPLLDVGTT